MTDPHMGLFQQAILARAADLRAVAEQADVPLPRLVEEARQLRDGSERLRRERYGLRSAERAGELRENR